MIKKEKGIEVLKEAKNEPYKGKEALQTYHQEVAGLASSCEVTYSILCLCKLLGSYFAIPKIRIL